MTEISLSVSSLPAAAAPKLLQSYPTLCDPIDSSPPGSPIPGSLQARTLEWVVIPYSRDLPNPGMEPGSPTLQADSLPLCQKGTVNSKPHVFLSQLRNYLHTFFSF